MDAVLAKLHVPVESSKPFESANKILKRGARVQGGSSSQQVSLHLFHAQQPDCVDLTKKKLHMFIDSASRFNDSAKAWNLVGGASELTCLRYPANIDVLSCLVLATLLCAGALRQGRSIVDSASISRCPAVGRRLHICAGQAPCQRTALAGRSLQPCTDLPPRFDIKPACTVRQDCRRSLEASSCAVLALILHCGTRGLMQCMDTPPQRLLRDALLQHAILAFLATDAAAVNWHSEARSLEPVCWNVARRQCPSDRGFRGRFSFLTCLSGFRRNCTAQRLLSPTLKLCTTINDY